MYLISYVIALQVLSTAMSFDMVLEGTVKLTDDFYKGLNKDLSKRMFNRSPLQARKFARSSIMRANTVTSEKNEEISKFVEHIQFKGVKLIKDFGDQINKDILLNSYEFNIDNVTKDYVEYIDDYFKSVEIEASKTVISDELILLDMVETSCRLIRKQQMGLLNKAVLICNEHNIDASDKIEHINQTIHGDDIIEKEDELRYICVHYKVCKTFPAITDYIADFIVELQKLPGYKLFAITRLIKTSVGNNMKFFETICGEDEMKTVSSYLNATLSRVDNISKLMSITRSVCTERFKIIQSPNLELKLRLQAIRIIIDIINKAFENDHAFAPDKEFNRVVKLVRSWKIDQIIFPTVEFVHFFDEIIKVLIDNLNNQATEELSVLIETFVKGRSGNEEIFRTLFSTGSKYAHSGVHDYK